MKNFYNKFSIFLLPGDLALGDKRHVIRTVLGSCVSITIWHPTKKIGVMSHFMLPTATDENQGQLDGRYGDAAMTLMLDKLASVGINPKECQAKIFGGGKMFASQRIFCVGTRNGNVARQLLQSHGIPVVAENLFGDCHRKVVFDVRSGIVRSQQVSHSMAIAA